MKTARKLALLAPGRSGQAMTEYAIILAVLSVALVAPIDGSNGFMSLAIKAYRDYYVSYYYVLNLPFP